MTGAAQSSGGPGSTPLTSEEEDAFWRDVLLAQGATHEEIDRAAAEGPLELYALERYILDDVPEYDITHAAASSGLDVDKLRAFWRALGFPDPQPGEATFSRTDLEMLTMVLDYIDAHLLDETVALQMARVIGSSLARIATAQVEAADLSGGGISATPRGQLTAEQQALEVQRSAQLIPMLSGVMQSVWRRHLASAARARIMRSDDERERPVTVGFADLEGFTSLSQQLPEHELAEVVNRFEQIAYDTVARFPGARVVKMIGDEVMFLHDDVQEGAELALSIAERFGQDPALSDVRVGLAAGGVLERDGDVYGHVVNLANRIVSVAYPGSVVVSQEVHDALEDHGDYYMRSLRSHYLKDIGRVTLWTLRRTAEAPDAPYRNARERRAARQFLIERWSELRREARLLSAALPPSLRSELAQGGDDTGPSTGEFEALTDAVLDADLQPEMQVELLADLEAARRLRQLEHEAQQRAAEADEEAERRLEEIEREARERVEAAEREARRKVSDALEQAEEKSRRVNAEASRKVQRVAEDAEKKADKATREAKAEAERKAKRRARRKSDRPKGE